MTRKAIGAAVEGIPLSPGISTDDYVFVSGHVGDKDDAGQSVEGIERQTDLCLLRLESVLRRAGSSLDRAVKVTVFLRNAEDFPKMNQVYARHFGTEPPTRSTIVVGLVRPTMLVEIECIASLGS